MADAKQCDVCDNYYDPALQGLRLQATALGYQGDVHDLCTPLCLLRLAQRRNPAATAALSSNGDDISGLVQKLSLTMDVVVLEDEWPVGDHAVIVDASLFRQAQGMVEEMVSLVLHVTEPEPEGEST